MPDRDHIIVGGLPNPIGGVTTFLRRLSYWNHDRIHRFLDIYPGEKLFVHPAVSERTVRISSALALTFWFIRYGRETEFRTVLFNFSTVKSLILLAILPKRAHSRWSLILHHGHLPYSPWAGLIFKAALRKFDRIYPLSDNQAAFYASCDVHHDRIRRAKTYCRPIPWKDDPVALDAIGRCRRLSDRLVVMSGLPSSDYGYETAVKQLSAPSNLDVCLAIFLYGDESLVDQLVTKLGTHERLVIFRNKSEEFFNTFLGRSDRLLRLNTIDSFGIAVADAVSLGVEAVATNVCDRAPGAILIEPDEIDTSLGTPVTEFEDRSRILYEFSL